MIKENPIYNQHIKKGNNNIKYEIHINILSNRSYITWV